MLNIPSYETYSKNVEAANVTPDMTEMITRAKQAIAVTYSNASLIIPHAGQLMWFGDAMVDMLYTHEDLAPAVMKVTNSSSLIYTVTLGGQRIVFLNDAHDDASTIVYRMYGSTLKSDIVQVAHHGYEGASLTFYQVVNPETVLWPMNIVGWQETGYGSVPQNVFAFWYRMSPTDKYPFGNRWLVDSGSVKKIIVSGFGTAEIPLPFAPGGEKLGDFQKYFDEHKQD